MIIVGKYEDWARACRIRGLTGPYAVANIGYQFVDEIGATAAIWNTSEPARGSIFDDVRTFNRE
jgi:hypothetical protein